MTDPDAADALWTWCLDVYAAPAVKAALLDAQNRFGAQVTLILWAAHAATRRAAVSAADARAARAAVAFLTTHIAALRDARRRLAARELGPEDARVAAMAHIAEAEIALEHLELAQLARQATRASMNNARETLDANVAAALTAAGLDLTKPEPKAAHAALVAALAPRFTV